LPGRAIPDRRGNLRAYGGVDLLEGIDMAADVKVFGANWCYKTQATRRQLEDLGIGYEYIDVEQDSVASEWVKAQNGGREKKPTVVVGTETLIEPDRADLERALRSQAVMN
jgi:glutaredoxin